MMNLLRRALALVLVANMAIVSVAPPALARMTYDTSNLVQGLPAGAANSDGSLSIPAGAAPAGSSVGFYIEGTIVGTATAAADGSATLAKPLFPAAAGAAFQYGAQKTSPSVAAPGTAIPAYNVYNQFIPNANDATGWITSSGATLTKLDATSLQLQTTATGTGTGTPLQYLSEYISALPAGQYTLGVTAVMTAGDPTTTSLGLRFFDPQYAQNSANPTIALNTPFRLSLTYTVTGNRNQSVAVTGNKLDASTSPATFKLYNLTLAAGKIDPFAAASDGSLAAPQLVPLTAPSVDYTAQYYTKPVFPTDPVFTKADAKPAFGNLLPGATNVMHYDFTKATGNIRTRAMLEKHFFLSSVNPGYAPNIRNTVSANNPYDGVDGAIGYARMRAYPEGHPYNLHKFKDAGLYLDVIGYQNDKQSYLYPFGGSDATTYAGYIRSQTLYRPGMVFEVKAQFPSDMEGWGPTWLLGFTQISPGRVPASNGDPTFGYQANPDGTIPPGFTPGAVQTDNGNQYQLFYPLSHKGKTIYGEFDSPDMWNDTSNNPAYKGRTMSAGIVNGAVSVDEVDTAYHSFFANSGDYTYVFPKPYTYKTGGTAIDAGVHTFTFNWRNDGSNTVDFLCDGVVYLQGYKEYYAGQFYNILTKRLEQLGMMDMIGGQFGRGFSSKAPYTPDGGTKGLLMVSMDAWIGNLDLSSITIPTNGLSNYPALTLNNLSASAGTAWTATIGNGRSSDTRVRATSSDGTALTVTGTGATRTVTGTFAAAGAKTITLREIPYTANSVAIGVPTTTTFTVNAAAATALSISGTPPSGAAVGQAYSFTPTVTGGSGTKSYSNTYSSLLGGSFDTTTGKLSGPFTSTGTITGSVTVTDTSGSATLSGISITVAAAPANGTTTFPFTGDADAMPSGSLNFVAANDRPGDGTFTMTNVTAGTATTDGPGGMSVVPVTGNNDTGNNLRRVAKAVTITGNTAASVVTQASFTVKAGTGSDAKGRRYFFINGGSTAIGQAVFDLVNGVVAVQPTTSGATAYIVPLGNGWYRVSLRNTLSVGSSRTVYGQYQSDGTTLGDTTYVGDGTSGVLHGQTYFARAN